MSEDKSHFKIKKGDIEIEYSGNAKDANSRYKEAFDWVKTATVAALIPPEKTPTPKPKEIGGKPGRGGLRSNVVSKAIDGLVSGGWLDKAKTPSEVLKELERKAVPGVTIDNVSEALKRRARSGVLDRIKGTGKEYTYMKKAA
jgi:hypothetical protein